MVTQNEAGIVYFCCAATFYLTVALHARRSSGSASKASRKLKTHAMKQQTVNVARATRSIWSAWIRSEIVIGLALILEQLFCKFWSEELSIIYRRWRRDCGLCVPSGEAEAKLVVRTLSSLTGYVYIRMWEKKTISGCYRMNTRIKISLISLTMKERRADRKVAIKWLKLLQSVMLCLLFAVKIAIFKYDERDEDTSDIQMKRICMLRLGFLLFCFELVELNLLDWMFDKNKGHSHLSHL